MNLEFRFAISPNAEFYSTVRLAALSLRSLGSPYDSARILVSVGDHADLDSIHAANAWSENYPVEWRTVSADLFRQYSYLATGADRFLPPSHADVIVMCDADVCLVERIDELVCRVGQPGQRRIAGLQAHFPPFVRDAAKGEDEWRQIFAKAGLGEPQLSIRYSGDAAGIMGRAPVYLNYGFVAFSRDAFAAVAPLYQYYSNVARELTNGSFFTSQICLSLLTVATALETEFVSFAYNCSNDLLPFVAPDNFRINSVDDIRVIHYLRTDQFDRRKFLAEASAYAAFLSAKNLNSVNARLRDHILNLSRRDNPLFQ